MRVSSTNKTYRHDMAEILLKSGVKHDNPTPIIKRKTKNTTLMEQMHNPMEKNRIYMSIIYISYEAAFVQGFMKKTEKRLARLFNITFRYTCDVLSLKWHG